MPARTPCHSLLHCTSFCSTSLSSLLLTIYKKTLPCLPLTLLELLSQSHTGHGLFLSVQQWSCRTTRTSAFSAKKTSETPYPSLVVTFSAPFVSGPTGTMQNIQVNTCARSAGSATARGLHHVVCRPRGLPHPSGCQPKATPRLLHLQTITTPEHGTWRVTSASERS